ARAHPDVLERACTIKKPEQQGADLRALALLVPTESSDHAVTFALMLNLEHHPLVRLVSPRDRLRDDTVEPRTLEGAEPIGGNCAIASRWCQMDRRRSSITKCLQLTPPLHARRLGKVACC